MTVKSEISLHNFFIYNPTLGTKEGEEEKKLLYYYPKSTDVRSKIRSIGLSEAIFNFAKTFNPNDPCEVLETEKLRQFFYNPEPNIFLILTLNTPFTRTVDGDIEYKAEYIQNEVYIQVLKQVYQECKLFNGPFLNLSHLTLVEKLEAFYDKYMPTLRLQNCDILDVFQGIHFLPLDKKTFLHIQSCISILEASFSSIAYTMFLCHEQLVWSGLDITDTQIMFRYLVTNILYPILDSEQIQSKDGSALPRISSPMNNYGRFLTGATNLENNIELETPPLVHLHLHMTENEHQTYHLLIYNALSINVCLFIPAKEELNLDFYKSIDVFLSPKLTLLASEISSYSENSTSVISPAFSSNNNLDCKFIYFNQLNLAMKSCIHNNYRKINNNINIDSNIMRLILQINNAHQQDPSPTCETITKTLNDYWVIGLESNSRDFFIVIQHKNANLTEISEEVKKICQSQLENIFFCH